MVKFEALSSLKNYAKKNLQNSERAHMEGVWRREPGWYVMLLAEFVRKLMTNYFLPAE